MNLKSVFIACIGAAACYGICGAAPNEDVRIGHLPNGLTYYIKQNPTPAHSVDFFIAQKVGSVNEEENQRGLAHFLEHMCFNGTEHFPGNTLITWLESVGVRFGANLNAYTSTDETVYNICKVPSARETTLDSCIMILGDWSHRLLLNEKDIDSERGVIENEWRQRSSASNRMLERALPKVYAGSRYGERMPIGLMSVVKNFKPKDLRDYYHKWYYPANQAVVVVGDIDPDFIEERIRHHFADISTPSDAAELVEFEVPDNDEIIAVSEKDPEQHVNMVQIHFKHDPMDDSLDGTAEGFKQEVVEALVGSMLAARFDEMERDVDCPHTSLGIGETKYLMSRPKKSFVMRGVVKPGRAYDAVEAWVTEMKRAIDHGFSQIELDAAKKEFRAELMTSDKKIKSLSNTDYARRYVRNFIDGGKLFSPEQINAAKRQAVETVEVADVEKWLRSKVGMTGRNVVILSYTPDNEATPDVNEKELKNAFFAAVTKTTDKYVAPEVKTQLLTDEPVAGKITGTDSIKEFDAKVYVLSNGIKVLARKSDAVAGQIYVRGVGPGGLSQEYTPELGATMKLLDDGVSVSRTGDFTANDLKRFTAGRNLKVSTSVSNTEETVEASTDRENMRDAFRLMYLKATDLRRDDDAYRIYADQKRNGLRNLFSNPTQVMGDSIHRNVYSRHPLGAKETVETVDKADYATMIDIYHRRFEDMSDFTFYVAGDFDVDSLADCLSRYVATLPTAGRIERPRDIGYRFTPGSRVVDFTREMETPQSVVYTFYTAPADFNLKEVIKATSLGRIAQMRLMADLREEKGWTYSIKGHCSINSGMNGDDPSCLLMPVYIKLEPGHEDECGDIVTKTIEELASDGPTSAELATIKEYLKKNYSETADDNAYWLIVMKNYVKFGKDMHSSYLDDLESLSADDIKEFAAKVSKADRTRLIMRGVEKAK